MNSKRLLPSRGITTAPSRQGAACWKDRSKYGATPGLPARLRVLVATDEMPEIFSFETKGQPGSLGLGLSLSRRLARLMGGDLTYQGQKGSVFELVLPARDPLAVLPLAEPVDSTDSSADHLPRERAAAGRRLGDGT